MCDLLGQLAIALVVHQQVYLVQNVIKYVTIECRKLTNIVFDFVLYSVS